MGEKVLNYTYVRFNCARNIEVKLKEQTIGVFAGNSMTPYKTFSRSSCLEYDPCKTECHACEHKPT